MLTEYKVTDTSPLHSAQAACSLIVIHIHTHTVYVVMIHTHTGVFVDHTYSYHNYCMFVGSYIMHLTSPQLRRMTFVPNRRSARYKGHSLW